MKNLVDLSVVILTKNEENNIEKCIKSAQFAKEILVFDSESTDNTREIAQRLGAKVVIHPWTGSYGEQRNAADKYASCDWILQIDADELITEEFAKEIEDFFKKGLDKEYSSGEFPRKEKIFGKYLSYGKLQKELKRRFYRKGTGKWIGSVHEYYECAGKNYVFKNGIIHDSYKSISIFIDKINHWTTIDANQAISEGKKFSLIKLFTQPFERFFSRFIVYKGYKDGFHGFVFALLIALNYFIRQLKIWEMEYKKNKKI